MHYPCFGDINHCINKQSVGNSRQSIIIKIKKKQCGKIANETTTHHIPNGVDVGMLCHCRVGNNS